MSKIFLKDRDLVVEEYNITASVDIGVTGRINVQEFVLVKMDRILKMKVKIKMLKLKLKMMLKVDRVGE